MLESFGREAITQSRRSVLCFTNKTSSYAYSGEATTSPLVAYNDSHTLTKPHSSLVILPALRFDAVLYNQRSSLFFYNFGTNRSPMRTIVNRLSQSDSAEAWKQVMSVSYSRSADCICLAYYNALTEVLPVPRIL